MNANGATTTGPKAGDKHYRAFVGAPDGYDILAALQFNLLTTLGLVETHHVLDVGCGSFCAGRLLIPYLLPKHYCGLEPEEWLVRQAIENELGQDLVRIKQPAFSNNAAFELTIFGRRFDFILAESIFSHAAASQISACLHAAARCLNPSGLMAASFALGDDDYTGSEWVSPQRVRYTEAGIARLATEAGLAMRIIEWPHPEETWMLLCLADQQHRLREPTSAFLRLDPALVTVDEFVEQAEGWGCLDGVRTADQYVYVRGWARNAETNVPIKDVLITDQDRRVVASAVTWAPRRDVADFYHEPALVSSGFAATFPKNALRGGPNRLSVYAYLPQPRRAIRLQCGPAATGVTIQIE